MRDTPPQHSPAAVLFYISCRRHNIMETNLEHLQEKVLNIHGVEKNGSIGKNNEMSTGLAC